MIYAALRRVKSHLRRGEIHACGVGEAFRLSGEMLMCVRCAEHIAFPLGKVARCGAARTVTDEGRPPAAGVLGAAVISEGSSVGLYPAAHRAAYFPL